MLNLLNIVRISGTGGGTGWMVSDSDDTADHPNDPPSPHCAAQTSSFSYFSSISFSYFSHKPARLGKKKCFCGILDLKNTYQANVSAIVIFIAIDLAIVI